MLDKEKSELSMIEIGACRFWNYADVTMKCTSDLVNEIQNAFKNQTARS